MPVAMQGGLEEFAFLSERLASLGIMGDQIRAPLKPPQYDRVPWCSHGFQGEVFRDVQQISVQQIDLIGVVFLQSGWQGGCSVTSLPLPPKRKWWNCLPTFGKIELFTALGNCIDRLRYWGGGWWGPSLNPSIPYWSGMIRPPWLPIDASLSDSCTSL